MARIVTSLFDEPTAATPLHPDERVGLKQTWIAHRRDLNEAEQENILRGADWARRRRDREAAAMLTDSFARSLHRRMFGDVWTWAGAYRRTARNIGIDAARIATDMPMMFDDVRYRIEHATYPRDEIAVRLHHRLVAIHPFPNGNGRHGRLMADLLVERLGGAAFGWGGGELADIGTLRARYIAALRAADDHDIAPLVAFART